MAAVYYPASIARLFGLGGAWNNGVIGAMNGNDLSRDSIVPGPWRAVEPTVASAWFGAVERPWWIAGGWALDLFLGRQTRAHGDLDVGVLRRDLGHVLAALPSWEIFEARNGALTQLEPGQDPGSDVHGLWCRRSGSDPWILELMLDERTDED